MHEFINYFGLLVMALMLGACVSMKESTAVNHNGFEQGISVVHGLPKILPGKSSPIPGVPYVFILPDSAATLLVPIPFVGDAVVNKMHQSASNELALHGEKATLGSLFIVGGRIAGVVSPDVLAYPNIDIIEDANDYVIARSAGDMKTDGQSGGMLFGIHYFHRNQLHTYKVTAEGNK